MVGLLGTSDGLHSLSQHGTENKTSLNGKRNVHQVLCR